MTEMHDEKITDKERLDFLEQNPDFTLRKIKKHWSCYKASTNYPFNSYVTARCAIDAAIKGTWDED